MINKANLKKFESLEKVSQDMSFVIDGLKETLCKAGNVERLVILPMISDAQQLINKVDLLLNALTL